MNNGKIAAVVLAAGKGTRINAEEKNKVMYEINGRPMIGYTMDLLEQLGLEKIIVVVGFAAESVKSFLGSQVDYVYQRQRLGTGHAVQQALKAIPEDVKQVLVLNGDDSAFYPPEKIQKLLAKHQHNEYDITVLTVNKNNPSGFGRIVRGEEGRIQKIVEEKNASTEEKKIHEVNTACYCFNFAYLKKVLPKIKKNSVSGEYYLTDTVGLGLKNDAKIGTLRLSNEDFFQGVNTREQLQIANEKMKQKDEKK
jgi:bifunctional UDP-N-acetylglucosamine pyrophosphorylase/glucosamine-1-phosphate N-acetyltransferase